MAADMDPNDHDTMHFGIFIPFVGYVVKCRTPSVPSSKIADNWDEVTCRMCSFYEQIRNGAA